MKTIGLLLVMVALFAVGLVACGDDNPPADDYDASVEPIDAGVPDADCITDPVTSEELLNACTSAQRIEKHPVLPLLNPDGSLPPLPI